MILLDKKALIHTNQHLVTLKKRCKDTYFTYRHKQKKVKVLNFCTKKCFFWQKIKKSNKSK